MKKIKAGVYLLICVFLLAGCADAGSSGKNGNGEGGVDAGKQNTGEPALTDEDRAGESALKDKNTAEDTEAADDAESEKASGVSELPDGIYTAEFHTDSSMFHVSEAYDGKGTLTVENGEMVIHISLASKNIVNLYPGPAREAKKEGAKVLIPTEDTVTYSDGFTEEVYGFDVPVPVLEEEFELALIGKKGIWYDHKVSVSNPAPVEDKEP